MGKKKFFDKKKSATFQLMARDTSDPIYESDPSSDRVFVRVDTNQYTLPTLGDDDDDNQEEDAVSSRDGFRYGDVEGTSSKSPLPDHVRREILELGYPDDGYNYLFHLREIKNAGAGSAYYQNPKANFDDLPHDVKAYDASRLNISKLEDEPNEKSIYTVASKTVNVKIQRALDPEIVQLLDDSHVSAAGSDSDDLEEDFVIKANLPEESLEEDLYNKLSLVEEPEVEVARIERKAVDLYVLENKLPDIDTEKLRARRHLDEQFDLLELQDYASDCEDEFGSYSDEDENQVPLAEKLNHAFKDRPLDGFELDGKYKLPSDLLHDRIGEGKRGESLEESAADVILRCKAYGEKYEDEDVKEIAYEESSEDEDVWDCETIITTYSNLDNHPGKIGAPEGRRKKKVSETISSDMSTPTRVIALKGKDKLPVDFLPRARKQVTTKEKDGSITKPERKQPCQESKEDKKERKAAVKEERRLARRMKKETKELYKCEGQRAQKVAAFTGPSAIHIM